MSVFAPARRIALRARAAGAIGTVAVALCLLASGCAPIAQVGTTGVTVQRIQRALNLPVNGVYSSSTAAAVSRWQTAHHLPSTGVVDVATMNALFPFQVTERTIGTSVQGRPVNLEIIGNPNAARKVLVLGCIHGNECAGVPVLTALSAVAPPAGIAYYLVDYPNPDGAAVGTRQNAHLVDLNRNFPGWQPNGSPGYVYYPGPGPLSEPESRAIYTLINTIKPTVFLSYHQAMNIIDFDGGNLLAGLGYAQLSGEPYVETTHYRGSATTWANIAYPHMTVLTVELPAAVNANQITAHFRAAQWIAAHG
ncbi:MAG TPA: M14 family zinc carboxypeptidase [Frankiaceae bacterium]|jgi:murein tripeptide amidase MpaA|nr:M14 family zinc carboxypeptidase [Frankiaceae bacterium]